MRFVANRRGTVLKEKGLPSKVAALIVEAIRINGLGMSGGTAFPIDHGETIWWITIMPKRGEYKSVKLLYDSERDTCTWRDFRKRGLASVTAVE